MKKYFLLTIVCGLLFACTNSPKTLVILHTNDTHSQIEPISKGAKKNPGLGGAARRASIINEERKKDKDLLLFDAGDFSQGTPYFNLFKGRAEIEIMNTMGYDAGTLGNHEFDNGVDTLVEILKLAKFPIVCANYKVENTPLEGLVKKYVILNKKGLKIGVFGLSSNPYSLISPNQFAPVEYLDPYPIAQEIATMLKNKGCDLVICLSHLGFYPEGVGLPSDPELAQVTKDIDIIVGGHTHSLLLSGEKIANLQGEEVLIGQTGKSGCYMGKMTIEFE